MPQVPRHKIFFSTGGSVSGNDFGSEAIATLIKAMEDQHMIKVIKEDKFNLLKTLGDLLNIEIPKRIELIDNQKLIGVVSLKELLINGDNRIIEDIMETNLLYAYTTDDQEYVADTIAKYGLLALPIVDKEQRLVGIVTVDDAIDVLQEEATEDIEKMAAIVPSDKPYAQTGVFEIVKKRIPWLLLLMISATVTGKIISSYEKALESCVSCGPSFLCLL